MKPSVEPSSVMDEAVSAESRGIGELLLRFGERMAPVGQGALARFRYGGLYQWYALLGVLDVMLTWAVIHAGGFEANWIAAQAVALWGVWGLVAIKSTTVAIVVAIAEFVGARRHDLGLALAIGAVVINVVPVALGALYLATAAQYVSMPEYWAMLWWDRHDML